MSQEPVPQAVASRRMRLHTSIRRRTKERAPRQVPPQPRRRARASPEDEAASAVAIMSRRCTRDHPHGCAGCARDLSRPSSRLNSRAKSMVAARPGPGAAMHSLKTGRLSAPTTSRGIPQRPSGSADRVATFAEPIPIARWPAVRQAVSARGATRQARNSKTVSRAERCNRCGSRVPLGSGIVTAPTL